MPFWRDIAAFVIKALIIVAAFAGLVVLIARLARSGEGGKDREIKVTSINGRYDDMRDALDGALLGRKERKARRKARKREAKTFKGKPSGKRIFVLNFKGDLRATAVR